MRHRPAPLAALLAGVIASATASAESVQCTPISAVPFTIAAPGSYCLGGDLASGASGTAAAITIASDDVALDLNGHSLVGPGGGNAGYGVYAIAHHGLRIRNGVIRDFSRGVFITDTLVGFPPIFPSGASTRHEISELRVEGASTGISVLGHFSSVHDNLVVDATQSGISTGSSYVAGNTGAIDVRANRVLNTIAAAGATNPVYGIIAGGTGSLVQDNFVSTVRGPGASAAIYASSSALIVSHNRESDVGTGWAVYCPSGGTPAKVDSNISSGFGFNTGVTGCSN